MPDGTVVDCVAPPLHAASKAAAAQTPAALVARLEIVIMLKLLIFMKVRAGWDT
jgi:hypothetical protein